MGDHMFWRNYRNTLEYTFVSTVIAMALTTTYAYALSKPHLKGRRFFVGIALEERDLVMVFGDEYRRYKGQVSMVIPWRRSA